MSGAARNHRRFSSLLQMIREQVQANCRDHGPDKGLSFQELIDTVGSRGNVFLPLFLSLPFLQPIPIPGVSTLFGLMISLAGIFLSLGRAPWLPKKLARKRIESSTVTKICITLETVMFRLEKFIRPRGQVFLQAPTLPQINGLLIALLGFLLSLPLPIPFSNSAPALSVFLLALGTLEEDFLILCFGYLATLVALSFFAAIVILPYLGLQYL